MKNLLKNRFFLFAVICIVAFCVLGFRLAYITIEMGEYYTRVSEERKRVEMVTRGARGEILDRNGIPLAVNTQNYVVQINRQDLNSLDTNEINNLIMEVIKIVEENGDRVQENIPIKYGTRVFDDKDIPYVVEGYYYEWNTSNPDSQRARYQRWRKDAGIRDDVPQDTSPEEMLEILKDRYRIDDDIPDEMARKIISIRLDLYMNRFLSHTQPVIISEGIGGDTISQLETFASDLPGIQVVVEAGRYYPQKEMASHIIGYVGKMTDRNIEQHEEQYGINPKDEGYDIYRDKYGQDGIEAYAERWLTGSTQDKHGELIAEVDSTNTIIKVLKEEYPEPGNDVILTLDSRLQKSVENILEEEIYKMREGLEPYAGDNIAPLAMNGAAVVLDVNTGEILAMASYPSFDLNLFNGGISTEDYTMLQNDPAKPFSALAFQGGMAPGSVFKMLIGMAALEEGKVTVNETIYDRYRYKQGPACWSSRSHGNVNVVDALKVSCNYYFTVVGDRLGIDNINKWAQLYGLSGPTGLEVLSLPNKRDDNVVANPEALLEVYSVESKAGRIRSTMREDYGFEMKDEHINQFVEMELVGGMQEFNQIKEMLRDMGYFLDEDSSGSIDSAVQKIRDALRYGRTWNETDTLHTSIGQSVTHISPLAVARYTAALVNGGKVLETRVIKQVVSPNGTVLEEKGPVVVNDLDIADKHVNAIKQGMWDVVYRIGGRGGSGTAVRYFADMDPEITLGGKTGTAQVVAGNPERNNAWFTAFTPYEEPEVAVVVAIPNGKTSGNAAPVARRIIEQYHSLKVDSSMESVADRNQITP